MIDEALIGELFADQGVRLLDDALPQSDVLELAHRLVRIAEVFLQRDVVFVGLEEPVAGRIVTAPDGSGNALTLAAEDAVDETLQGHDFIRSKTEDLALLQRPVNGIGEVIAVEYSDVRHADRLAEALVALAHDVVITIGIYALTGREVSTATVAAILTVLGYSIYDTIIIFDRIRENVPLMRRQPFATIAPGNRGYPVVVLAMA